MQQDLDIRTAIAIHWGVFALADDNQDDPPKDLEKFKKDPKFAKNDFRIGINGTQWDLPEKHGAGQKILP